MNTYNRIDTFSQRPGSTTDPIITDAEQIWASAAGTQLYRARASYGVSQQLSIAISV